MSKSDDPARLFDPGSDTTEGVRAVLRAGQRGLPGPEKLARLAARLPLGPLPPPTVPVRVLAPVAAPSVLPGVIVGAVLGLAVVAGMAFRDAVSSPAGNSTAATVATNITAPSAAPRPVEPRPAEARVEVPDPVRVQATASSAPRGGAPAVVESSAPSAVEPPSGPSVAAEEETEVHLLQRAQSALGADPSAALALTGEHARRFPGGALGQERELIAVTALVALGRKPEAQTRAASLLERFPGSAYKGRLESLGLGK